MSDAYTDQPPPEPRRNRPAEPGAYETPEGLPKLGSLAQSARSGQLKQAKALLIGVGVLMAVLNLGMMFTVPEQVRQVVDAQLASRGGRAAADPVQLKQVETGILIIAYFLQAIPAALGVLFIIFGLFVNRFPVPITITSLILFLLFIALSAILEPLTLIQGLVIKIIFIAGIIKAIQAALAYEREKRQQTELQAEC
jgi:hypothetical protein